MLNKWCEFWRLVVLVLIWATCIGRTSSASAQTIILDFEDLSPTGGFFQPMPSGYGGINWSDVFWPYDAPQPPFNPKSGIVRISSNRNPGPDDPLPRGQFQFVIPNQVFNGAWFAGPNPPQLVEVQFLLYNDGILVHSSAILQVSPVPTFLESGYSGPVDAVTILGNEGEFVFDDLSYTNLPTMMVSIDIKPGNDGNNINVRSHGKIPVAILSAIGFDAPRVVDPDSLTFGRTGDEPTLAFCSRDSEDVNGDGLPDLLCLFRMPSASFQSSDTQAILKGTTTDGRKFSGADSIHVVGVPKLKKR